ncbi:MAG: hypothetical protein KZQ98_14170, partial [Candidatus Thiodiazotropha sp. (ex Lucinoma borealis)]|nr:hypothetical protein [Candidatus Thiodiazotropha sp. (ex Lucinoma borealis)]
PEGSALGVRPEGSALGVRPEGSALGVRPEGVSRRRITSRHGGAEHRRSSTMARRVRPWPSNPSHQLASKRGVPHESINQSLHLNKINMGTSLFCKATR